MWYTTAPMFRVTRISATLGALWFLLSCYMGGVAYGMEDMQLKLFVVKWSKLSKHIIHELAKGDGFPYIVR